MADSFSLGAVTAVVKADTTDFKKGMQDAKNASTDFKDHLGSVARGIQDFANAATLFTGILVAGVTLYGKSSFDAYKQAEVAQAQLEHAVIGVTKATQAELEATMALADELERKGVLDGDNIKMGLAQLSTFGLSNRAVQGLSGSLADLAVNQFGVNASGDQLADTANMIAKALNGQFAVLEKSGIRFSEAQKNTIEFGTEMEKVAAITEGFAQNLKYTNEVAKDTSEGGIARLGVRLENIQEEFGKIVANGIGPFARALANVVETSGIFAYLSTLADKVGALSQLLVSGDFTSQIGKILHVDEDSDMVDTIIGIHDAFVSFGEWVSTNKDVVIEFLKSAATAIGALVVIGTVNALLIALLNPLTLVAVAITAFAYAWNTNFGGMRDTTQTVITSIVGFFNELLMPIILVVQQFITEHWTQISAFFTETWEIIKITFGAALEFIWALIQTIIKDIQTAWKTHQDWLQLLIGGAWILIVGTFKMAAGLITVIFGVLTGLLTGDWKKAWDTIQDGLAIAISGLTGMLKGFVGIIAGVGSQIFNQLKKPFEDAWRAIEGIMNNIRDSLDFTKRHSASILDIVNRSVSKVNGALEGLNYGINLSPSSVASTINNAGQTMSIASINVSLDGAVIGNANDASDMAIRIGNGIIQQLKNNVRF